MKKVLAVVLCLTLCFALCACGGAKNKLQNGIWCHEFTALGLTALQEFEFEADGTFVDTFYINGEFNNVSFGRYEMTDSKIILTYESGESIQIDYAYNGGALILEKAGDIMHNRIP